MKLIEKILVATDFSQHSRDALRMAILLAKGFHSEIILIHVIPEIKDERRQIQWHGNRLKIGRIFCKDGVWKKKEIGRRKTPKVCGGRKARAQGASLHEMSEMRNGTDRN